MWTAQQAHRTFGWTSIAAGIGVGMMLGLWSFDGPLEVPQILGAYGDTARRMVRLGHIAMVALGMLNVVWALDRGSPEERRDQGIGCAGRLLILGCSTLPLVLFAAAAFRPLKYLLPLPAGCVLAAVCWAALGAWRASLRDPSGGTGSTH